MTRLLLPVCVFGGEDGTDAMWSTYECVCEIESMPVLWKIQYGEDERADFVLFAQDHRLTNQVGDWGEHKTVVLTPWVTHQKFDNLHWPREFGFKEIDLDLGWLSEEMDGYSETTYMVTYSENYCDICIEHARYGNIKRAREVAQEYRDAGSHPNIGILKVTETHERVK